MYKFFFLLLPLCLVANTSMEDPTPELSPKQIQRQLDDAEAQFKQAKEMFNPWYAGPLLTGGAHMMAVGSISLQPYVFGTDNYAIYSSSRHTNSIPDLVQLNGQMGIQTGITSWLDVFLNLQGFWNWQNHQNAGGFGDTSLILGFKLLEEGLWVPAMKLTLGEVFPTGRYQNIGPSKASVGGIGGGSFQTSISFHIAKLVLWSTQHPLNLRATFTYTMPSIVNVKNFNTYGGGYGTNGRVHPGNQFNTSVGIEWSFTQRWVFANDFVYVTNNRTKFVGNPGITATGATAAIGSRSNDQFSLAPAIEYNPTPNLNFVAGVWFTVVGRNSSAFISGVFTVAYTFSVN